MFANVAAAWTAGVMPGTAAYAAAVLSLAAAVSLARLVLGKPSLSTLEATWGPITVAYLLFVMLPKIAMATAPKIKREVPAMPAAVPISFWSTIPNPTRTSELRITIEVQKEIITVRMMD